MAMIIYVNGYPMGGAISGCEYIGYLDPQEMAEISQKIRISLNV